MDGVTMRPQLPIPSVQASSPTITHAGTHRFNCSLERSITISQAFPLSPQMHLAFNSYRVFHHRPALAQFPSAAMRPLRHASSPWTCSQWAFLAKVERSQEKGKGFGESVASGPADYNTP